MDRKRLFEPFVWLVVACGAAALLWTAFSLPVARLDVEFWLLALLTVTLGSRGTIRIPRVKGYISVSDTLIFLILLLYGGEAAVLMHATEACLSSLRFSKKRTTILFNIAAVAFSTFLTVWTLRILFGSPIELPGDSAIFIVAICVMGMAQYVFNSAIVATGVALKTGQSLWTTWYRGYLWSSVTFFAGASAAGIIAKLIGALGFFALLVTAPIITIIYFTYRTYLRNVESVAAQAELAQRHVEELNHYIAEQERIRAQYSQIEKLSALGELASGVAHDFNNTLGGILARAQLLQRTKDPEKIKRGLEIIVQAAEDGAKTVKRIQDFARQRRDHDLEVIALGQLLMDVSELTRPRWKDRAEIANVSIKLALHAEPDLCAMGDASELREVLINMVFNAVDAMPQGGALTLSATEEEGRAVIRVRDTGTGMSDEVRSRIFDPFFTTKGKAGMGLGLAVSYGIIRRHQGEISVESAPGEGSTFRISLPLAAAPARTPEIAEPVAAPPLRPPAAVRVLVVDDEDLVREVLRDILESEGCETIGAQDAHEALALLEANSFDAVFTDVGMPGMSGWELARAIRLRDRSLPLAVITGWGEAVGSQEQKEAEVDWVVTKPFAADRIAELSREIVSRREQTSAAILQPVAA